MEYWIVPSNRDKFDMEEALKASNGQLYWKIKNVAIGDMVFMYKTKPDACIKYMFEITKANVSFPDTRNQMPFWKDRSSLSETDKYASLKLVKEFDTEVLTFDNLRKNGIKGNIQGKMRCPADTCTFIMAHVIRDVVWDNKKQNSEDNIKVPAHTLKVDAEARKIVEKAAVEYVTKKYQSLGYQITSREKENVGWDLDAEKEGDKLKLEVKGIAQSQVSVHISQNEYKTMMANKDCYRLCVVINAINNPQLVVFIWKEDLGAWVSDTDESIVLTIDLKPSYLAVVK